MIAVMTLNIVFAATVLVAVIGMIVWAIATERSWAQLLVHRIGGTRGAVRLGPTWPGTMPEVALQSGSAR